MSFDVFFQGFRHGDTETGGGHLMREVLQPYIAREEPEHRFVLVRTSDGEADVYLGEDGMMANHVQGDQAWDLLVDGARSAGWVILPVGCATCITDESQREHLPEGLDDEVALVRSGAELTAVIRST